VARTAAAGPPGGAADWPAFGSVFVGGGTPTLLDADVLGGVLRLARDAFPVAADAEVTVEANPENLDAAYLETLVRVGGLTRLSIGAQSFSTRVLDFLDRAHDPERVPEAVQAARAAGVASVSVDLIYGSPAETADDWRTTLDRTVATGPDHISCYTLTLEPNTPYAARVRTGAQAAPDEDVQADRMRTTADALAAAGYTRYEVSNWARPGHQSRHNRNYWRLGDYLGIGAGAHGHWAGRRWWNLRSPHKYAAAVEDGATTVAGSEQLTTEQVRMERLLLGLRTVEGVTRADVEPLDEAVVADLVDRDLLADDGTTLRLTARGLTVADAVTLRLAS
jgi:putative oxygen-independent coproporphyrinogen III oxidase